LREAGIVHIFAQETQADRDAVAALYGLPALVTALLGTLPRGCSVLRIGEREPLRLVDHLRAGNGVAMTDTDAAMLGRAPARAGRPGDEPAAAVPAALDPPPVDGEPDIPEQPRGC
jgi:hypothetical protein